VLAVLPAILGSPGLARPPASDLFKAIVRRADTIFLLWQPDETSADELLSAIAGLGPRVVVIPHDAVPLLENPHLREAPGFPLLDEGQDREISAITPFPKRVFDLLTVFLGAAVLLPISLAAAVVVLLSSPGPVLFRQARALCSGGREFLIYKFRTMYRDADGQKARLLVRNEADGALFKVKNDPRVVPGARFLRRFSLDEVPQFLNVLKREMSVVGPRPLPVEDLAAPVGYAGIEKWQRLRDTVPPGITGLWQVSGRSELSYIQMLVLDLYYSRNRTLGLDVEIAFATVPALLSARGSS
jgi:lipopolysaccharide/colanic/teichoic acid biosynthesis glycosyltransferase